MIRLPVILDDNGNEQYRVHPISLSITEKITPLSTATMNVTREDIIPDRSYVELFVPGRSCGIFRARIPESIYGGNSNVSIKLEHAISEVGDWIVREKIEESVLSFPAAISLVFSHYRGTKWQLGRIEATEEVVCNISVTNVLTAMLSLVKQLPNYMMTFDFSSLPWTINFVQLPQTVTAEGRLSRNVISARVRRDDSSLFTRVYLKGLPITGTEEIGHLDADTISKYGVIETVLSESDYTEDEALLVAKSYLEQHKKPTVSVQIDGIDFSELTNEPLDKLELGKLYRFAVQDIPDAIEEHVTQLSWRNPQNGEVTIQLSEEEATALKIIHEQGASQAASTALSNTRESEYKSSTESNEKKTATGTISFDTSGYSTPKVYTVNIGMTLSTVNYAVLLTADNGSSDTEVVFNNMDYGVFAKTKSSFKLKVDIPSSSLPSSGTAYLRWFVMAK